MLYMFIVITFHIHFHVDSCGVLNDGRRDVHPGPNPWGFAVVIELWLMGWGDDPGLSGRPRVITRVFARRKLE